MRVFQLFISLGALALCSCGGGQIVEKSVGSEAGLVGAYMSYFLPKGELSVTAAYDKDTNTIKVTHDATANIVPDLAYRETVVYRHNDTYDDQATIAINAKGLLTQISTTSTDRTVDIVKGVNEIASEFAGLKNTTAGATAATVAPSAQPPPKPCGSFSVTTTAELTDYNPRHPIHNTQPEANGCTLTLTLTVKPQQTLAAPPAATPQVDPRAFDGCPVGAVCFRVSGGFDVYIEVNLTGNGITQSQHRSPGSDQGLIAHVVAPVKEPIGVLYFNREPFVQNETTAEFTDGMLTKITAKNPSVIASALSLPAEIIRSLTLFVRF